MIIVKNRELLIPGNERYIGTTYDTEVENRLFCLDRFNQSGFDLSNLTFRLDMKYPSTRKVYTFNATTSRTGRSVVILTKSYVAAYPYAGTVTFTFNGTAWSDGSQTVDLEDIGVSIAFTPNNGDTITVISTINSVNSDTVLLTKEISPNHIYLTWEITESQTAVAGTVFVSLRGFNEDVEQRYASFPGVFYAEKNINSPDGYPGNLSELEQLEAAIADALKHAENMNAVSEDIINDANAFALLSEAYAKGTRNDIPVSSGQAGYHNNSKYWSEISHQYANTVSYKKVYINVAEMVEDADLIDGQVVRTLGYHAVNDGGGSLYRIHSTTPSGYYETLTSGLYAELIIDGFAAVEAFGAYGDNTHDDTTAINSAVNFCKASGKALYFQEDHIYKITSSINMRGISFIQCKGKIVNPNAAILIGTERLIGKPDIWSFKEVSGEIKVIGASNATIIVNYATKLTLYADGDDENGYYIAYSSFYLGYINTLEINSHSGSRRHYVNENKFFGGHFVNVLIDGDGNNPNNNTFYGSKIEGETITINRGYSNVFHDLRGESTVSITFGAASYNNIIIFSWDQFENGLFKNVYQSADNVKNKVTDNGKNNFVVTLADSFIKKTVVYSLAGDSNNYDVSLITKKNGSVILQKSKRILITDYIPLLYPFGVYFESDQSDFRAYIYCYDSNLNLISTEPTDAIFAPGKSWNANAGCYQNATGFGKRGSNAGELGFYPNHGVAYVKIAVETVSYEPDSWTVKKMDMIKIESIRNTTPINILPKYKKYTAPSAPSLGVWDVGEMVYNSNPTPGSALGWICTTAGDFNGTAPVFKEFGTIST